MSSTLTLIGLNRFMERRNDDLFKDMILPSDLNRDDVKDTILMRSGEFEVVYADPYFLQQAIGLWARKWYRTFNKWDEALKIQYNPLDNYDRTEEWTDTNTGTVLNESAGAVENTASNESTTADTNGYTKELHTTDDTTTSETGTVKDNASSESDGSDSSTGGGTNNTTNSVTAYDNNSYVGHDKNENTTTSTASSTQHTESSSENTRTNNLSTVVGNTRTDEESLTETNNRVSNDALSSSTESTNSNTRTDDLTARHQGRIRGNIGVMSSQELLMREIEVARFNIYEQIADCFVQEFCIMVY